MATTSNEPSCCIQQNSFKEFSFLARLLELNKIPKEIYVKGALPTITFDTMGRATPRILTIVGSRKNTSYGKRAVSHLLSLLDKDEVIILSGLAYGIDGEAHNVALRNNIRTIAIPGSGLDHSVLYPSSHRELARKILENDGVLLSELKDTERAAQWTFVARNRIMAALSDAVLIVEAEEKSGTLVTARLALELGRDIGAVPGDIFSSTSEGPLSLIRDGATPISSPQDLRELLHLPQKNAVKNDNINVTDEEKIIMKLLREPKDKDTLLSESGLTLANFLIVMTTLEMKGYIEETFGEVRKIV